MLIQKRFDYKPLERMATEHGRRYVDPAGKLLPSVTTILSAMADKTYIQEWTAAVGEVEADRIKNEASDLGTEMHNNLESYILGKPLTGSFMAKALAKLIIKEGLSKVDEIWGTEVALFSEGLYAGTTDLVGVHNGTEAIMDFKNSRSDKTREKIEDYFLQLCAYSVAHNEMFGTDIKKGVVMIATRDAKYQEFIIEGDEFLRYQSMWIDKLCAYYSLYGHQ